VYYIRVDRIIACRLGTPEDFPNKTLEFPNKKKEAPPYTVAVLYDGAPHLKSITHGVETKEEALEIIKTLTNYKPLLANEETPFEDNI